MNSFLFPFFCISVVSLLSVEWYTRFFPKEKNFAFYTKKNSFFPAFVLILNKFISNVRANLNSAYYFSEVSWIVTLKFHTILLHQMSSVLSIYRLYTCIIMISKLKSEKKIQTKITANTYKIDEFSFEHIIVHIEI